ncbi:MAG TPA: type IV toxin-antitoxin system AbiEi family antitoxin domain-containing protein, partial [Actinopolymorphaceae bacterium]
MSTSLRGRLAGLAVEHHGIFTRSQALDEGYSSKEIQHLLAIGAWHRLRVGIYVETALWRQWDSRERHLAETRAALLRVADGAAASHVTAGVVHGFDLHQPDLSWIHLTRPRRHSARKEAGIDHHVGRLDPHEVVDVDGIAVTSPARTVVDIAASSSFEAGLVTADSALRKGLHPDDLRRQFETQVEWPGSRTASKVRLAADGRAQSPGETLSRVAFMELGLPAPDLQGRLDNPDGSVFAYLDFVWWDLRTAAEFDGKRKYYRDLRDGEDPGDIVWR